MPLVVYQDVQWSSVTCIKMMNGDRCVHFASYFPNIIYNVFMHNNTLWSNSNAISLIICKVYTKRENTGNWNSGPEKSMSEIPILHISKWAEILWRIILEYIINIGEKNYQRGPPGGHKAPGHARPPKRALVCSGHPGPPSMPIFWYIRSFDLEKKEDDFWDGAPLSRQN